MIVVLGIGPGDDRLILAGATKELKRADYVIGADRQLQTMNVPESKAVKLPPLAQLEEFIREHEQSRVVLLASGDPLLYGIGNWVVKRFGHDDVTIIPGISSVQYLFHQLKLSMNDVYLTSSHGRVPDFDFILEHDTVGMVTDKRIGPFEIAQECKQRGEHRTIFVGERLSYPDEKIGRYTESSVPDQDYQLNVVVIKREG